MSEDINSIRQHLWEKMRNKSYRDNFVAANISTGIAAQLLTMRESRNWQQKDVAEKTGMAPARISVMENPSYEKLTLTTLKRLARAFDVALIVRFVPFRELVNWVSELSPEKLDAVGFQEDRPSRYRAQKSAQQNVTDIHPGGLQTVGASLNMRPHLSQETFQFEDDAKEQSIQSASAGLRATPTEELLSLRATAS